MQNGKFPQTNKLIGKTHPAVAAVWAAVIAAGHLMPTIPLMGTGSSFSLATALFPLSGILFGPLAGALCSAAGGFIGNLIAPNTAWMGPFTFIIGTTTAFTSGCITRGNRAPVTISSTGNFIINGGIIVYIAGTALWYTLDTGRAVFLLPIVFYGSGFIAMTAGIVFNRRIFAGNSRLLKFLAVWLSAYGGLVGGASVGNFFSLILFEVPKDVWNVLVYTAPVERAVFAAGTMLIGVPLLTGLKKMGIPAGPEKETT